MSTTVENPEAQRRAEKYEEIVQVIHRHRAALKEGDPSHYGYWTWIMTKVFKVVAEDVRALVGQDFLEAGKDTVKVRAMYAEWRKEIYAEMDKDAEKYGGLSVEKTKARIAKYENKVSAGG